MRYLLSTLLLLLAGGCAVPAVSPEEQGDKALSRGDYPAAIRYYEESLRSRPDSPLLAEKVRLARSRAERETERRVEDRAEATARAAELGKAAERHLDRGRPLDAVRSLRLALSELPGDEEILSRLAEAEQAAERSTMERADRHLREGDVASALETLAEGRRLLGKSSRPGRREVELEQRTARDLLDRAEAAVEAGRPATATLFLGAARALRPEISPPPAVARAEPDATLHVRLVVRDGTGGRLEPKRFADRVAEEIEAIAPHVSLSESGADMTATVTVESLEVVTTRSEPRTAKRDVVTDRREIENPERIRLRRERDRALRLLEEARPIEEARRRELDALERLRFSARVHIEGPGRYGPYDQAVYYRLLANARAREAVERLRVEELEEAIEDLQDRWAREPRVVVRTSTRRMDVTEVTTTKTARARAVTEIPSSGSVFTGESSAEAAARATRYEAPAGELPPEGELPGDPEMADRVLQKLAKPVAELVRKPWIDRQRALAKRADELYSDGRRAEAVEAYAHLLLFANRDLPLESRVAEERIRRELGIGRGPDGEFGPAFSRGDR